MPKHYYTVAAEFQRHRYYDRTEHWTGEARNMVVATRRAIKDIMKRKGVLRLRHHEVTFRVERIAPPIAEKKTS